MSNVLPVNKLPEKQVHLNPPQLHFALCMAKWNYLRWGRGTGKSDKPLPLFILNNVISMPRSNGCFVAKSFEQILTSTLPAVVAGLESMGYIEDFHFSVGKPFNRKHFKHERAFIRPKDHKHYIQFWNGTGMYMLSQDRNSVAANGRSVDWGVMDEAKMLDFDKLEEELILPMRGNPSKFDHLFNYKSLIFTTDTPVGKQKRWLDERIINKFEPDYYEVILPLAVATEQLKMKWHTANGTYRERLDREIKANLNLLNDLKRGLVYYSEASTLDNIHAIGWDAIMAFQALLSEAKFRVSVLNENLGFIENGFYPDLDPAIHAYEPNTDYSYADNVNWREAKKDCRWDKDLDDDQALHIGADSNAYFNCVLTAQYKKDSLGVGLSLKNVHWVKNEERLQDLAQNWCDYFKTRKNKTVHFHYDHTFVQESGRDKKNVNHASEWVRILRKNGFAVVTHYLSQSLSYANRNSLWSKVLRNTSPYLKSFEYNRINCAQFELCMLNTESKIAGDGGYAKEKKYEKNPDLYPPEEVTHITEAADTLLDGMNRLLQTIKDDFVDNAVR